MTKNKNAIWSLPKQTYIHTYIQAGIHTGTEIQADKHTDIHTYIQAHRQTDIHTGLIIIKEHKNKNGIDSLHIHTQTYRGRHTYRQTDIQTDRHTQTI